MDDLDEDRRVLGELSPDRRCLERRLLDRRLFSNHIRDGRIADDRRAPGPGRRAHKRRNGADRREE